MSGGEKIINKRLPHRAIIECGRRVIKRDDEKFVLVIFYSTSMTMVARNAQIRNKTFAAMAPEGYNYLGLNNF